MKNFQWGKFYLSIGWFWGEPFKLFSLSVWDSLYEDEGIVSIFDFQVLRFIIDFGYGEG